MPFARRLLRSHGPRQSPGCRQDDYDARRRIRRGGAFLSFIGGTRMIRVAPRSETAAVGAQSPGNAPPRIEAHNLSKHFGAVQALSDVSMSLRPGSFRALLGENGAGKSTLVKCIMGTYRADSGSVRVGEREVELKNPRQAHALGIGMVYQHFTLVENMTVLENMVMAR